MEEKETVICPMCFGEGVIRDDFKYGPLFTSGRPRICSFCGGYGVVIIKTKNRGGDTWHQTEHYHGT